MLVLMNLTRCLDLVRLTGSVYVYIQDDANEAETAAADPNTFF